MITILIGIIWVLYGIIAAHQDKTTVDSDDDVVVFKWCVSIIFSPIIFIVKCFYGAFKQYH